MFLGGDGISKILCDWFNPNWACIFHYKGKIMKAYGLPRKFEVEYPDKGDIWEYGLKSSTGKIKNKTVYRSNHKNSAKKRRIRRYFKRVERLKCKQQLKQLI